MDKHNHKILLVMCSTQSIYLFIPDITIPGIPTARDNFNIICRLDGVVERLVGVPLVSLSFVNSPGGAPEAQSRDGSAYIIQRIFNPGKTSDVGTYSCVTLIISSQGIILSPASDILQIQSMQYISLVQ